MNNTKKILIGGVLVSVLSATSMAQADGFFSKLFGGSSNAAGFKSMLSHVPADTSYMFANKNPIPADVMDFHMKRSQEAFKMISKLQYKAKKAGDGSTSKGEAFFKAITDEFSSKLADKKFEDTGLSLKATSMIYGYNEMPVIRMSIADKGKILELIKRAEEESGYKVKFAKCGEFECIKESLGDNEPSITAVLLKDQLAMALFRKDDEKDVINHLIGKADPKAAYSEDKWDAFLKNNNYKGFGDGFVNLKKLYSNHKEDFAKGFFNSGKKKAISEEDQKACTGVIDDHVNNMPGIIFGSKNMKAGNMDYEMVFQTSEGVSSSLQEVANKTNIAKRSVDPIFSMGLNLNAKKLGEAVTTYSNFLIKSGETHKCKAIDAKEIRKGMGGMLMVMNMGLAQLKSVYVSLNELDLDERMQPKKLDVFLSIGSDDPAGLLAMATMMSPGLANLKVPDDGSAVKLPAGAIPSKGMPLPPISISRSDKAINLMIGNDKPELKDYKGEKPEIMTFAIDGKRYYEIIGNVLKVAPQGKGANTEDLAEMMSSMGGMMGKVQQEISADKRGLVIESHVQY